MSADSARGGSAKPRTVVFDTNVVLSMYVFADSRFAPLRALVDNRLWRAVTNEPCLAEFCRVLAYPLFALDSAQQATALAAYRNATQRIGEPALAVPLPRCTDADDQKFLELARDSRAECLITSDKALLKLDRRLARSGMFRVITPDAAVAESRES